MHQLGPILFSEDPRKLIDYLRAKGLLRSQQDCNNIHSACSGVSMQWTWQATRGDGFVWRCPVCHKTKSIRNGSFFSQSKLPLHTWVHVLHQWAMEVPVTKACKQMLISEKRCIDVYQWCRDVCSTKLLVNPIVLGGPGTVVQIDESLFTHSPKVNVQHYIAIMCNICKQVNHIIL